LERAHEIMSDEGMSNFTPRAQELLSLAREEASRLNHDFVDTEHLLLGLIKFGEGTAAKVLQKMGLDFEAVRLEVEKRLGTRADQKTASNIPYTPEVEKILDLASREARQLQHTHVGTGHILLGLLFESEVNAARLLKSFGMDLHRMRQEILKELVPRSTGGAITLNKLWNKVYRAPYDIFFAAGKVEFMELFRKHLYKIEIDKKYEYERENELVYSGVDTFRAWMDGQIGERGPLVAVQSTVNSLINQNRKLRDRQDPGGSHASWTNPMYLLKPYDDAAYVEDIEKKEFEMCKGNVSKPGASHTENWGLIDIPAWITGTVAAGPEISDEEVAAIEAELQALTQGADADLAWGNIVKITLEIDKVERNRQRVIIWHGQYMGPHRATSLADIWNKKAELHTLLRIRLQIQRLEADNMRLTSSGHKVPRARPEDPDDGTVDMLMPDPAVIGPKPPKPSLKDAKKLPRPEDSEEK
jgi:hypothetical protein